MVGGAGLLRFAVLGPVVAARAGLEVPLGPVKQQAVLAVLLLNNGRPVSRDEITAVLGFVAHTLDSCVL